MNTCPYKEDCCVSCYSEDYYGYDSLSEYGDCCEHRDEWSEAA